MRCFIKLNKIKLKGKLHYKSTLLKADYYLILDSCGGEIIMVTMDGDSFYLKLDVMKNHGCDGETNRSMVGGERFGNENFKTLTCMEDYGMVADFFKMVEYDMDEECDVVSKEVHLYGWK